MKLVDNAKQVWHHYSTIAMGMAGGLQGAWATVPDSIKSDLPSTVGKAVAWITLGVLLFGLGGKFIAQPPSDPT